MVDAISAATSGLAAASNWMDRTAATIANALTPGPPAVSSPAAAPIAAYPNVDLAVEMPNLLMAAASYELNLAVIDRAQSTYRAALDLVQPGP